MGIGIYKQGQGYWTRMMSAVGGGMLVASCAMWLWGQLQTVDVPFDQIYLMGGVAAGVMLFGGLLVYWLVYAKVATSEFLIATEGEMKKVNWSSRKEILGSTWVVIAVSFIIAALLFVVDLGFSTFFKIIKVLETG